MNLTFEKKNVCIRESRVEDILVLRSCLRKEDVMEIWAMGHMTPERELMLCYAMSCVCRTLTLEGKPIAMFGLIPDFEDAKRAMIFFLGSQDIELVKKTFLEFCTLFIDGALTIFPTIYNFVDARYEKSLRWLKWLGAKVDEPRPQGIEGLPFHEITFRRI